MRKIILVILVTLLLVSCGGGGDDGNEYTSDASRYVGTWNGTAIELQSDDGQPLENRTLRFHIEYAGKQSVGGITIELITVSAWLGGVLLAPGVVEAPPGGALSLQWSGPTGFLRTWGQFIGNTASGSWYSEMQNPSNPAIIFHSSGTWTASRE